MKRLIILAALFFSTYYNLFSNDTLYVQLNDKLDKLIIENSILNEKVDSLDKANNKILTATYSTIGFCFMLILGIGIWNKITEANINNLKLKNIETNLKNELQKDKDSLRQDLIEIQKNQISLKHNYLTEKVNELEFKLLKYSLKFHDFQGDANSDFVIIYKLLNLAAENKEKHKIEEALNITEKYLEIYTSLNSMEKDTLREGLSFIKGDTYLKKEILLNKLKT